MQIKYNNPLLFIQKKLAYCRPQVGFDIQFAIDCMLNISNLVFY